MPTSVTASGVHASIVHLVVDAFALDVSVVDGAPLHYESLTEFNSILRALAAAAPHAGAGVDAVLQDEFLSFAQNEFLSKASAAEVAPAALKHLDSHVCARMFLLATARPTLVDYVLFGATHAALSALKDAATKYPSVVRWFNHVQHLCARVPHALPPVVFKLSSLEVFGAIEITSLDGDLSAAAPAPAPAAAAATEAKKKEEKPKAEKPKEEKKADDDDDDAAGYTVNDLYRFDIRVGKIVAIENHPTADALYVEQIDVGEAKPLQVVSGLRKWVPVDQMLNRLVVFFTNLKPSKLRDVVSNGMVLCASNEHQVEPILPPAGTKIGERVTFAGASYDKPADAPVHPKKLAKLLPELSTSADGIVQFKNVAFTTSGGSVTSSIKGVPVK